MNNMRYSPEIRERAICMVFERQGEYDSQWVAMGSIAAKISYNIRNSAEIGEAAGVRSQMEEMITRVAAGSDRSVRYCRRLIGHNITPKWLLPCVKRDQALSGEVQQV